MLRQNGVNQIADLSGALRNQINITTKVCRRNEDEEINVEIALPLSLLARFRIRRNLLTRGKPLRLGNCISRDAHDNHSSESERDGGNTER